MTVTDPVADMFTRIRNGLKANLNEVVMPHSKLKHSIAKLLKDEGFIKHFDVLSEDLKKKSIKVVLKYSKSNKPVITTIQRISKPSKRHYVQKCNVPKVLNGFGISILSTSKGIMTGRQARINNVGGELMGIVH
jgi:small subunit ribosomal protein S8